MLDYQRVTQLNPSKWVKKTSTSNSGSSSVETAESIKIPATAWINSNYVGAGESLTSFGWTIL
jgi:hypothetical protein